MKRFSIALSAVALPSIAPILYGMTLGRTRIELVRTCIKMDKPISAPLNILHLSDLHLLGTGRIESAKLHHTLSVLQDEPIDLIVVTGDFIEENGGIDQIIPFLMQLPSPTYGMVGCLGNHDYAIYDMGKIIRDEMAVSRRAGWAKAKECLACTIYDRPLYLAVQENDHPRLVQELEKIGMHVLTNRSVQLTDWLWVGGVDDLMEGNPDPSLVAQEMPSQGIRLILAHHPDSLLDERLQTADMAFSGHVHGGQVRLPWFDRAIYTQGSKMNKDFTSGWLRYGRLPAYVSRGWGEAKGTPIRWNCRPEITLITVM